MGGYSRNNHNRGGGGSSKRQNSSSSTSCSYYISTAVFLLLCVAGAWLLVGTSVGGEGRKGGAQIARALSLSSFSSGEEEQGEVQQNEEEKKEEDERVNQMLRDEFLLYFVWKLIGDVS